MAVINPAAHDELPNNYAWLRTWDGPYEGPMTTLLKFGWANCLTAQEICQSIFGRNFTQTVSAVMHSRTLLALQWMRNDGPPDRVALAQKLANCGLDRYTANWFHSIASDTSIRFCPACLNHGYQSVLFQIDALALCPIHGEVLLNQCRHCGTTTPRYAITIESLDRPFHCHSCGKPYADKFQPSEWSAKELHKRAQVAFKPIAMWLKQLDKSQLRWWQWREWFGPWLDEKLECEKRLTTFNVLARLVPLDMEQKFLKLPLRPVQIGMGSLSLRRENYNRFSRRTFQIPENEIRSRRSIYKSIRRHAVKELGGCARTSVQNQAESGELSWGDEVLQLSLKKCAKAQSLLLWRLRFEETVFLNHRHQNERPTLHLRPAALNWPWNGSADDAAWAMYVLTSLHASIEVVREWWLRAESLPDADIYGRDKEQAMALYADFSALLSPVKLPVLPRISIVSFESDKRLQNRSMFVVGPYAKSMGSFILPSCPSNVRCTRCSKQRHMCLHKEQTKEAFISSIGGDGRQQIPTEQKSRDGEICPLDRLTLSPELDGSSGTFRCDPKDCLIDAKNDLDAIRLWLETVKANENTFRIIIKKWNDVCCGLCAIGTSRFPLWTMKTRATLQNFY